MLIQAAKAVGRAPTALIVRKNPGRAGMDDATRASLPLALGMDPYLLSEDKPLPAKELRDWDLLLTEAEALVEMERCKQCGQPRYICQSDDPDIAFDIRVEECHATQARERAEKARNKGKKPENIPVGVLLGTDPYSYSQTPLDEFRQPYYEQQHKTHEEKVSLRPVVPRDSAP